MQRALDTYDDQLIQEQLRVQSLYYQQFYAFEGRVPTWKRLLEIVINEGTPVQKLIIE